MHRVKRWIRFRYPKILLMVIAIAFSYLIFRNDAVADYISNLGKLSYFGVFIAGMLFTFGFSSPLSAGFFIVLNPQNIWLTGVFGGLGALATDMLIFRFIRFSFMDEFERLERTKPLREATELINGHLSKRIKLYLLYTIAGLFIASPLPDEAGIIMLAGLTRIKQSRLAILSFLLNTTGIIVLLAI